MRGNEGLKTAKIDRETHPDLRSQSEVYHVTDVLRSYDPPMAVHIYRAHPMTKHSNMHK